MLPRQPRSTRTATLLPATPLFRSSNAVVPGMAARGSGTIPLTGASASVKGYAQSAPFAMGKFGLRGLAQSLAREFQPQGLHIAHFVIDGGIRAPGRPDDGQDSLLDPDAKIGRAHV